MTHSFPQISNLFRRTQLLLGDIAYPGLDYEVSTEGGTCCQVRIKCVGGKCNVTGKPMDWNGRWWRLSPHMTDSEIVATCFKALLTALEHEARERFTFKGQSVYDSHLSVHQLAKLRADRSSLDAR